MAAFIWTDAAPWIGAYAFQGITNKVAISLQADTPECTAFNSAAVRSYVAGLLGFGMSIDGFWDVAADLGVLGTLRTATSPITLAQATTVGSIAYLSQTAGVSYGFGGQVGELFNHRIGCQGTGVIARGALCENATRTATGSPTAQQLGALSATQKLYYALHVVAASGSSPTVDVTIRSDDNSGMTTPTTRATLTQITGIGSVFGSIDGAIADDYWRPTFTIGGSGPSFTIAMAMGIR